MREISLVVLAGMAALALAACGAPDAKPEPPRALGMNDVTLLLPLPADRAAPVLLSIAGDPATPNMPLIARGIVAGLVDAPGDIAPKNGLPVAYEDYHVVALRFDLCDRAVAGPCPDGADGRLRLVLQPVYTADHSTLAHDIALHAFYPIPAGELAGVVAELRALARLQDAPTGAPLSVNPALTAPSPPAEYAPRLRALALAYARWDRLVKLTVFGQDSRSAAFAWRFRGIELHDNTAEPIQIAAIGAREQTILVAGGDTVYNTDPVADAPQGFELALNGPSFAAATPAERMRSLEALVEIQNPARHDADDVQCVGCHVATFLTARRAAFAGIDPTTIAGRYTSPYNTAVDTIAARDGRVLRALGWASSFPAISQRVANDTAQVLGEIERRFPIAAATE